MYIYLSIYTYISIYLSIYLSIYIYVYVLTEEHEREEVAVRSEKCNHLIEGLGCQGLCIGLGV